MGQKLGCYIGNNFPLVQGLFVCECEIERAIERNKFHSEKGNQNSIWSFMQECFARSRINWYLYKYISYRILASSKQIPLQTM